MPCARSSAAPGLLAGGDAGGLPARRRRSAVGRRARPPDAGARAARAFTTPACRSSGPLLRGGRRRDVPRHRQRRQGDPRRRSRQGHGVLRQQRDGSARAGGGARRARSTSAPRPTAASTRSTPRARPPPSSIPTTSTSGRWPSIANGNVFAATGDKGMVYGSRRTAKARSFSRPRPCTPCRWRSMPNSQLLVGTGSPGRVFRVDGAGKGFLLLDTHLPGSPRRSRRSQGRDLRRGAERPLAGRRVRRPHRSPRRRPRSRRPSRTCRPKSRRLPSIDVPGVRRNRLRRPRRPASRGPTGAVYRVQADGLWDEVWAPKDDAPYDVAIEPDGALLVATGAKGKIFRLSGEPVRAVLLTRVPAQQATLIARANDRTLRRDRQSRLADGDVAVARRARHLRVGREGRALRLDVGRDRLARERAGRARRSKSSAARATPGRRTKRGAIGRARTPTPTARRSPARRRDTCSGAPC